MKRDNGDYNLLKFVGIGAVLFCLFMIIGSRFVTVGIDSTDNTKEIIQEIDKKIEYLDQKAELEDATILGKFWNSKGHFIVVYNGTTKAPEVLKVELNEWELMGKVLIFLEICN